jgi:peptidoglycan/LPS O-acetylase OafA/YrhL
MNRSPRRAWRLATIWVLLWLVAVAGITPWLAAHVIAAMFPSISGFEQFWRLPFGAAVLGLAVAALLTFRDPSPWRAIAIAAFLGTAAAFLMVLDWGEDAPATYVYLFGMVAIGFVGAGITVASYADDDESWR